MNQNHAMRESDAAKPAQAARRARPQPLTSVSATKRAPVEPAQGVRPAQVTAPAKTAAPAKAVAQAAAKPIQQPAQGAKPSPQAPRTSAPAQPVRPGPSARPGQAARTGAAPQGAKPPQAAKPSAPPAPVEAPKVVELDLKRARKARERALEAEVHGTLLDTGRDHTERAAEGFMRLAEKLIADMNEQFEHVQALQAQEADEEAVDGEISRLLRMIEKRSKIFGEVEEALAAGPRRHP